MELILPLLHKYDFRDALEAFLQWLIEGQRLSCDASDTEAWVLRWLRTADQLQLPQLAAHCLRMVRDAVAQGRDWAALGHSPAADMTQGSSAQGLQPRVPCAHAVGSLPSSRVAVPDPGCSTANQPTGSSVPAPASSTAASPAATSSSGNPRTEAPDPLPTPVNAHGICTSLDPRQQESLTAGFPAAEPQAKASPTAETQSSPAAGSQFPPPAETQSPLAAALSASRIPPPPAPSPTTTGPQPPTLASLCSRFASLRPDAPQSPGASAESPEHPLLSVCASLSQECLLQLLLAVCQGHSSWQHAEQARAARALWYGCTRRVTESGLELVHNALFRIR
ncbi:hypothetical protein DUNSADRAFT_4685 [Dunaliella salina]|uniref:Uncharacterized protein n=1 Tax=Dunaliella salina TaxID=3046 RepID=A0ABQ7FUN9_DUNSA|nr:hypothetical protein DUNSADRAFT_4685 [Dunaliella salina]|eukprot:KAF5826127.1 hypothetical protein DUNSADRAFT_4685 [Dunaliella salina]